MSRPVANDAAVWKWVPIAAGSVVVMTALYQIFQVSYMAQQTVAALAELSGRFERLSARVGANETANRGMERTINEVQTQFCAADDLRNLMHSNDVRQFAMLYEKVHGVPYPIGSLYYPRVCNR